MKEYEDTEAVETVTQAVMQSLNLIQDMASRPLLLAAFLDALVAELNRKRTSREMALVITKLEEAGLWLSKHMTR